MSRSRELGPSRRDVLGSWSDEFFEHLEDYY